MRICIILAKVCKSLAARLNNLATKLENKPLPAMTESNRQAITNRLLMMLRSRNPNLDSEIKSDGLKLERMILVVILVLGAVMAGTFFMFPSIVDFFAKYSLLICFLVALLGLGILIFETIKKSRGSKRLATRPSAEIRLFTRGDTKK
jgi:hypothetical protein